jgi:hypothetical protein
MIFNPVIIYFYASETWKVFIFKLVQMLLLDKNLPRPGPTRNIWMMLPPLDPTVELLVLGQGATVIHTSSVEFTSKPNWGASISFGLRERVSRRYYIDHPPVKWTLGFELLHIHCNVIGLLDSHSPEACGSVHFVLLRSCQYHRVRNTARALKIRETQDFPILDEN